MGDMEDSEMEVKAGDLYVSPQQSLDGVRLMNRI
jgi:hypothetical protein